jgi:hypothetical protein
LIGVVFAIGGWAASVLENPVLAVLSVLGIYLVVSRIVSPVWGLVAAVMMMLNPAVSVHALTSISHTPVEFCLIWGIYFLLRWSAGGRLGWVFGAGLILGCIPVTRYADSVVALGVMAFLLMHVTRFPRIWRHYLAAVVGAAIPIVPLLWRNQELLGAFWRTGYALTHEQTGFGMQYFRDHAVGYLQLLNGGGLGVLFVLGLIGFIWMICQPGKRALGTMLLLIVVPFLLTYMAYYWPNGGVKVGPGGGVGGSMRFLVPLVPPCIIAGVWMLAQITRSAPRGAKIAIPLVLIALQLVMYGDTTRNELAQLRDRKIPLVMATRGLEEVAHPGDVVLASNGLLQNFEFVREWKLADPTLASADSPEARRARLQNIRPPANAAQRNAEGRATPPGRPNGAAAPQPNAGGPGGPGGVPMWRGRFGPDNDPDAPSPRQAEKSEARSKLYTGSTADREKQFKEDVRQWAGSGDVYAVGTEEELPRLLPGVPRREIEIVKRMTVPQVEEDGPGGPSDWRNPRNRGGRLRRMGSIGPGDEIVIAKWVNNEARASAHAVKVTAGSR